MYHPYVIQPHFITKYLHDQSQPASTTTTIVVVDSKII